jgi:RNA-directed DNA polymerase
VSRRPEPRRSDRAPPARCAQAASPALCLTKSERCAAGAPPGSPCGYAPTGVAQARRDGEHPEAESDLLAAILEQDNLRRAWQQVKANHGAAGVDGVTIEEFPDKFRAHWPQLRQALEEGTYEPSPVRRVEMAKPDGGIRLLGIPTVLDRLIQQAIAQVLGPIFDPGFSACSFGFRPGRRAGDAVRHVAKHIGTGRRFAVDLDLSKFFDRVAHDILMSRLARKVSDRRVLRLSSAIASRDSLIGRYLRAGVEVEGRFERTVRGVPQGSPLSPLLANVVLDDLDKELEQRGHRFARYADDFVILVKSPRAGERVMRSVRRFLETRLKLEVNVEKSAVRPTAELTFLGFAFKGVRIVWSEKSLQRFQHRIRELTSRNWGVSMQYRLRQLALYMRGWMGYFSLSETYAAVRQLDHWIRRRLRCCYWKMWKTRGNRIRQLLRLGIKRKDAILHGLGGRGCWAMSKTPVINQALSLKWLRAQGLPSLTEQWVAIHYPTTVR